MFRSLRLGLALGLLVALPAFAQAPGTRVAVAPLAQTALDILVPIAVAVVTTFGTWLGAILVKKFGLDIEALHRDALQTTLQNAAGLIRAKVGRDVATVGFDVRNPIWAQAIEYVRESAPQAQAYFNLTPTQIAEKIAAKLPQVDRDVESVGTPRRVV